MITRDKILKISIFVGLVALVVIIFAQQINFASIDLGRHLENGKIVWQNPQVLFQNFYSYTEPNFSFINHHWLSGVIFYAIYLIGGFTLLSLFNILLAMSVFLLAFNFARKKTNFYLSAAVSIPVIFLLSERVEIRPEIFSYLLILVVWQIIDKTAKDLKQKRLRWLIPIFILWANLHIYFFIGLAILGAKAVSEFILVFIKNQKQLKDAWDKTKNWFAYLGVALLACLFNPNFLKGLLYPFNIFHNYGYEIAENKSIFYLQNLIINPNFLVFKLILGAMIISWILYFLFSKKLRLFELFISFIFIFLGLFASRNLAIFGIVSLIIIPTNLFNFFKYLKSLLINKLPTQIEVIKMSFLSLLLVVMVISLGYVIVDGSSHNKTIKNNFGLSLSGSGDASAKFFKDNNLSGPVFNNYDIGSALIFWLFPQEKVFVDNRPEAYSNDFFTKSYIPMQEDIRVWQEMNKKYQFKTIYFSHTDGTPWAQKFLNRILADADWSLVYFDESSVILINNELNDKELVQNLSLDKNEFRTRLRLLADNSNFKNRLYLASLAQQNQEDLLAEEIYKGSLLKYPEGAQTFVLLGYFYSSNSSLRDTQKSLDYFSKALENGYQTPEIYNQIGLVNWQRREYKKAESAWLSALKLNRNDSSAKYYLNQIKQLRASGELAND